MWTKENIPDQTGKTIIVTGANIGIGYETALALYQKGANVILACRDLAKADEAANQIKQQNGTGTLETAILDLSDLQSVKQFTDIFTAQYNRLDVLINNAGVMMPPASKTAQGFELQFGTNVLGHFALTGYLYPLLKNTPDSRIVTVSSLAYLSGSIDFENLKSKHSYDPVREYCQSKLGNILFSLELQRRIEQAGDGILSIAVQPGANKTGLIRHMTDDAYQAALQRFPVIMEPWQGALPSLYAAVENDVKGGDFYSPDQDGGKHGYPAKFDVAPNGTDEAVAKRLWELAEEATGVVYP